MSSKNSPFAHLAAVAEKEPELNLLLETPNREEGQWREDDCLTLKQVVNFLLDALKKNPSIADLPLYSGTDGALQEIGELNIKNDRVIFS